MQRRSYGYQSGYGLRTFQNTLRCTSVHAVLYYTLYTRLRVQYFYATLSICSAYSTVCAVLYCAALYKCQSHR